MTKMPKIQDFEELTKKRPERSLVKGKKGSSGRNTFGKITVRHRGGGVKRLLRKIDFVRDKKDVRAKVAALEYDPGRNAHITLLHYVDGEKRYILAPLGLKVGDEVITSATKAPLKPGNAMPLRKIPVGMPIHNLEIFPKQGGKLVRSAGTSALIQSKEGKWAKVKLSSGEVRKFSLDCFATIGQVGNPEKRTIKLGKAGRKRHLGIRPTVRGVAQHPDAHPHGGGEGRSGIGMPSPKTPWGKRTFGRKTRKRRKYSDGWIVKRRGK